MRNWTFRIAFLICLALFAGVASAEKIRLRFAVWDGNEALLALKEAIEGFEAAHPNIEVKLETVPWNSYFTKLLTQYAASVAPDVAMMGPEQYQRFAARGVFLPLNDFFNDGSGFDIKEYYPNLVASMTWNGQCYVLPRDIAPMACVYYNKRLFDEAGLPYPDGSWTWDFKVRPELKEKDFFYVVEKLSKKSAEGKPVQYGYVPAWQGQLTDMLYLGAGKRVADDYDNPTKLLFDDPEIVKIFNFSRDLALKKKWMPSGLEVSSVLQTTTRQLFTQGKAAMFQNGIWEVPELRKELIPGKPGYFEWDIALAPAYKDGTRAYPTGGSGYSIVSHTKHPKEAWLLTKWMAGEPGLMAMAKRGLAQPAIRKLALREPWIPGPNTPKAQLVPRNRIITDIATPHVVFAPSSQYWNEVANIMNQSYGLIYDQGQDAAVVMKDYNARAQQALDERRKEEGLKLYAWAPASLVGIALLLAILAWAYLPEFKVRRTARQKKENLAGYLFIAPWIIGTLLFTLGPMVFSFLMAFADWDIIQPAKFRGVGNFEEAFQRDPTFWPAVWATLIYTVVAVPLGLVVSLALALLLNLKVLGMPLWRTCYYIPSIASGVASALIWRKVFQPEGGVLNSLIYGLDGKGNFLGLASILEPLTKDGAQVNWLGNDQTALASLILMSIWGAGGGMVIMLAGLQGVPQSYYEAATVDGASPWRKLLAITIPMISPTIFFSLITGFIGTVQVFTQALLMTQGGPNNSTMFFVLHLYNSAFVNLRMGYASALAWILFGIVMVFTVLQLRASKWVYYEGDK